MTLSHKQIAIAAPSLGEREREAVLAPLSTGWLTQGPHVAAFEQAFAVRHAVTHALATTSCTTALHLALASKGIGPGDEVLVPAFTWVATANAVRYVGATPVFVDVDPRSFNIDAAALAAQVTDRTRAVIPVHLFGLCADMDEVRAAIPSGVFVLEDAACAAGAAYHGVPAGSIGDAAAFSFHPRKTITTGEGGMVTTNDAELAACASRLRSHGGSVSEEERHHGPAPYVLPDFDDVGFNYRMTDMQAAIGTVQLSRLDELLAERRRQAAFYDEALLDLPWLLLPDVPADCEHGWQSYVTVVDEDRSPAPRNAIMQRLHEQGIATRPGTHCVSDLGAYRDVASQCPTSQRLAAWSMAIPLHNQLTDGDLDRVVAALHDV